MGLFSNLINKLDRDKKLPGFQIVPGGIKGGIERVKNAYRTDPNQFNLYKAMGRGDLNVGFKPLDTASNFVGNTVSGYGDRVWNLAKDSGKNLQEANEIARARREQGLNPINKESALKSVTGLLQGAGSLFSMSPAGVVLNSGEAGVSSILRSARNKTSLAKNFQEDIANPFTGVASTGLGVKNPYLALAGDIILSPESVATKLQTASKLSKLRKGEQVIDELIPMANFKGVSPRSATVHPEDLDIMREFADKVLRQGGDKQNLGELGVAAQRLASHYLGENFTTISNKKLAKAFEWTIDLNEHIPRSARGNLPPGIPGVTMGIAEDLPKAGSLNDLIKKRLPDLEKELSANEVDDVVDSVTELIKQKKKLKQTGFSNEQIDQISPREARNIAEEDFAPFEHKSFNNSRKTVMNQQDVLEKTAEAVIRDAEDIPKGNKYIRSITEMLNPIKNLGDDVKDTVKDWRTNTIVARAEANDYARVFSDIPEEDGMKIIKYLENPTTETAAKLGLDPRKYNRDIGRIRAAYNELRDKGLEKGLDVGYIENYMNHVWKENPQEIALKAKSAGRNPSFTKQRFIPTYEEGIKMGLTPRFSHPAQLVAHYKYQLEKAVANAELVNRLKESGKLLPESVAKKNGFVDWKRIDAPFFPSVETKLGDGESILQSYVASPELAKTLNNIFGDRSGNPILRMTAETSKKLQDITLSGGVPYTPINSFTLANAVKDVTAGRIKSPVSAFFRSFSDAKTQKYISENQEYVKLMAREGIPLYATEDYTKMFKNLAENKTFKEVAGENWDKAMSDATFRRFLPQLQLNFFKDMYQAGIKDGMDEKAARALAGEGTKAFYGVVDNFDRSQNVEDALSSIFFAPKFRESMISFWGNTLKSLKPSEWSNKALSANRKFVAGALMTSVFYELANKQITGHWMHENKPGKEMYLEIPREEGRSWFIPILPSISTVPRRGVAAILSTAKGDTAGAVKEIGTMFSTPVSVGSQLATNKTFYGGDIYDEEDNALQKFGKLAGYAGEQLAHPFIGEPLAVAQGRKTPLEAGMGVLELPVYPSRGTDYDHLKGQAVKKYQELYAIDPKLAETYSQGIKKDQLLKANNEKTINQILGNKSGDFTLNEAQTANTPVNPGVDGAPRTIYDIIAREEEESRKRSMINSVITGKENGLEEATMEQKMTYLQAQGVTEQDMKDYEMWKFKNAEVKDRAALIMQMESPDFVSLFKNEVLTQSVADELEKKGFIPDADKLMDQLKMTDVDYRRQYLKDLNLDFQKDMLKQRAKVQKQIIAGNAKSMNAMLKAARPSRGKARKSLKVKLPSAGGFDLPTPKAYKIEPFNTSVIK